MRFAYNCTYDHQWYYTKYILYWCTDKSIGDVRQSFIVKRSNIVQNEKLLFYFSIKIRCFVKCIVCTLLTYKFPSFSLMHFKHLLFNGNYLSVNFACHVKFVAKYMSVQKCNTSKRY